MEVMEGKSYFSCKSELDEEEIRKIEYEIGVIERKITGVLGKR